MKKASDLVVVYLRGGDASDARAAVCVDLDRGLTRHGEEWAALVLRSRVEELVYQTRATQIGEAEPWNGATFGDGGGTVKRDEDGEVFDAGLNRDGLSA